MHSFQEMRQQLRQLELCLEQANLLVADLRHSIAIHADDDTIADHGQAGIARMTGLLKTLERCAELCRAATPAPQAAQTGSPSRVVALAAVRR